jgi:hypothetical protein
MASVPLLSTGRDTAVYLYNSQINRSAEKLNSELLGAETMKLNKALKDKDTFMRMMEVDPVTLISQGATALQAEKHKEFNEKWTAEMQKNKGQLTTDKEIEMRQDRIGLEGWQKRMGANQQRYLHELQLYQANPSKYDSEAFKAATAALYATGEYETGLRATPARLNDMMDKDVKAYFLTKPSSTVESVNSKGGKVITTVTMGDREEGKKRFLSLLVNDDTGGLIQDVTNEFMNLPPEEQKKILDKDNSGTITEDELALARQFGSASAIAANPIVKWAMDTKSERYVSSKPNITNPPSNSNFVTLFGQPMKSAGVKGGSQRYGDQTYENLYDFDGSFVLKNVPTKGGKVLKGNSSKPISTSGNIEGYLKHYDPDRDVFILAATGTDPNIDSGTLLEIPVGNLNQPETNKIPLMENGKQSSLGVIRVSKPTAVKKAKPY